MTLHTSRMASCDLYVVPHWSLAGALHAKDIYWWEFPANIEVSSSQERDEGYDNTDEESNEKIRIATREKSSR